MILLLLEVLLALAIAVFIVWWTMFSGRRRGERAVDAQERDGPSASSEASGQQARRQQE
jgi:uncharacterized membrane protein YccC